MLYRCLKCFQIFYSKELIAQAGIFFAILYVLLPENEKDADEEPEDKLE